MNAYHVSPPSCQHGSNCSTKVGIKSFSDRIRWWKSSITKWQMVTFSGSWLSTGEARIQVRTRGVSPLQRRRCGCALKTEVVKNSLFWNFRLGSSAGEPDECSQCYDMLNEDVTFSYIFPRRMWPGVWRTDSAPNVPPHCYCFPRQTCSPSLQINWHINSSRGSDSTESRNVSKKSKLL